MRFAVYLEGTAGRLFCTGALHKKGRRRKILIVPPFAEEMNKSRHVMAALSAAAEDAGHDVLLLDLFGTGDSDGEFSDATLDIWRADLDTAIQHLDPENDLELIGLRAGALLAADIAIRHSVKSITLLHPMVDGKQQLTEMLRLRLAGGLLGGDKKESAAQLKQRLEQGECLEIAGYGLSGRLATDLETLSLSTAIPKGVERVNWLELAPGGVRPMMPLGQRVMDDWIEKGVNVTAAVLDCDHFWATQEIVQCPEVVRETMKQFVS